MSFLQPKYWVDKLLKFTEKKVGERIDKGQIEDETVEMLFRISGKIWAKAWGNFTNWLAALVGSLLATLTYLLSFVWPCVVISPRQFGVYFQSGQPFAVVEEGTYLLHSGFYQSFSKDMDVL
jgi:hypothetical protein